MGRAASNSCERRRGRGSRMATGHRALVLCAPARCWAARDPDAAGPEGPLRLGRSTAAHLSGRICAHAKDRTNWPAQRTRVAPPPPKRQRATSGFEFVFCARSLLRNRGGLQSEKPTFAALCRELALKFSNTQIPIGKPPFDLQQQFFGAQSKASEHQQTKAPPTLALGPSHWLARGLPTSTSPTISVSTTSRYFGQISIPPIQFIAHTYMHRHTHTHSHTPEMIDSIS